MDAAGVDKEEARVYALFAPTRTNAILDLTAVTFLASMGIRVLITAARTAKSRGVRLVIVSPPGLVREALTNAGLVGVLDVVDDVASATQSLQSGNHQPGG